MKNLTYVHLKFIMTNFWNNELSFLATFLILNSAMLFFSTKYAVIMEGLIVLYYFINVIANFKSSQIFMFYFELLGLAILIETANRFQDISYNPIIDYLNGIILHTFCILISYAMLRKSLKQRKTIGTNFFRRA
jgi:hypothetical protein